MPTYTCPICQESYSLEDIDSEDLGAHEDCMGSKVWKECVEYTTPCCGVEPVEEKDLEDGED
jgi:hypothetical protein